MVCVVFLFGAVEPKHVLASFDDKHVLAVDE